MTRLSAVLTLLLCGVAFSACSNPAPKTYKASTDCVVSATNTDYAGCDLSHRNLSGTDFQSDDLRRANLSGANLDGANLQGVNLRGANTAGAHTSATTVCVNAQFGPCSGTDLKGVGKSARGS